MKSRTSKIFRLLAFSFLVAFVSLSFGAQKNSDRSSEVREKIRKYRTENEVNILNEFSELLSFPNAASDQINIQKNANYLISMLQKRGFKAELLTVPDCPPAVYGELKTKGAKHTILLYSHFDGNPVVGKEWATNPWKAVLRDKMLEEGGKIIPLEEAKGKIQGEWRLYARSSSDEKAAIMAMIAAVDSLKASRIPLTVNIKFIFEGEEEVGSPHMESLLQKYHDLLKSDALLMCGGPVLSSRNMVIYFGVRGGVGLELTVYGANTHLHSGHYGNWAPNPISLLANLIASMRDSNGNVIIKGFYDGLRPLGETELRALKEVPSSWDVELRQKLGLAWSEANNAPLVERIMLPGLNLGSIQSWPASGAAAIPSEAKVSIDFRLVPDQTPEKVKNLVETHIRERGFHIVYETPNTETRIKYPKIARLQWEGKGSLPVRFPMDLPFSKAIVKALEGAIEGPLIKMPNIGSGAPTEVFERQLKVPIVIFPIVNHDNNQHGPNENVRLQNLWDGIDLYANLFARLGQFWKENTP